MKITKYLGVATLLAGLATSAHAADVVDFAAAGSSAQFSTFTAAFLAQTYSNHYSAGVPAGATAANAPFAIADPSAPNEPAQVAIYWKGSAGNYNIAVFYQVDSTVGVRAFFNNDTLVAPTAANGFTIPAPGNKGLPGGNTDVAVPQEILNAVNGAHVNVGATDITPEDARVATERSINLGYNASSNPIKSAVASSSIANPVRFTIPAANTFTLTPLGAVPILVFTNKNAGSQFASLSGANLNIDSFQLAGFLSGQFNRTSDLDLSGTAPQSPVHVYIREPLSGTYNTIEYTNAESLAKIPFTGGKPSGSTAASGGQEFNVSSNPLNEPSTGAPNSFANAGRIRAIGTGELVGAVNGDATDALGYAFWSAGSFAASKAGNLRYLTVDGADPLLDNYNGGTFPVSGITFRNVVNGGYPLWSILRVVTAPQATGSTISKIIGSAITSANGTDFVPASSLRVFRSYHATPYTPGGANAVSNGNNGTPANGGDVGGAVFSINNDVDYATDFGSDLTNFRQ